MTAIQYITTVMCHSQSGSNVIRLYTQGLPVLRHCCWSLFSSPTSLHALPQDSTQRTCPHSPASNWLRRGYHHGNSKWEELHPTAKNRGHCSPRNQPSYPRTNCVWNLHYTSEPLIISVLDTCTHYSCYLLCVYVHTIQCRRLVITCTMVCVL